jgi:hypothetical protein
MAVREPLPALVGTAIVASGLPVYAWMRWRHGSDGSSVDHPRGEGTLS